jgi:protoporphyrinogen/coproporphyrinogen III oxidase
MTKATAKTPVVIIGAGLAGLTSAIYLRRQGIPVQVYEASPHLAGLARSFESGDGFTYDFGAHFITNRLAAAVGFSAQCINVPRYGESFWLRGRPCRYPFGFARRPRFVASAMAAKLNLLGKKPATAADWFRGKYGRALADEVAIPLTEAWCGAPADTLSTAVGEKIPSSILKTFYLRASSKFSRKTVAIGYCTTLPESAHVWHVYPRGGVGALCQHMADEVRDCIQTESPVEAILTDGKRATGVRVKGAEIPAAAVISTAPVHILAKLVQGSEAVKPLSQFRYRPMVFVNMRFEGRGLLPDVVVWTPGKDFPFFRLTETPLSMPWLAPEGKTMITADLGCQVGDETWKMPDEEIGKLCLQHATKLIPDAPSRYDGCRVLRTPLAYPVFLNEYEPQRKAFEKSTGIDRLYSVGRNGEFAHILMEDVFWRTRRKMRTLVTELSL